ncbi:D-Ala-D-Ala carboxypeptidase family metallohydrolase [Endozoicomonas sp. GU-1]|uniref:D-Ala-D-Ala carboxypeptidase family metallohydrolase n=1 Tax=Endozoicomonas sp. GU-1 TaxID=3009078 RepID=UPI0022B4670E|nr:D-Ala-D-Ala carboxypeptidase family metallohydrolase [Endozoicomonas sp. GU-1]WBA86524.1 D-Ala-D-Ala carboxypeptidase family metallohydrolase [Endozoicomonas sp. GU-1]
MSDSPWKNFSFKELACKCGSCDESSGRHISPELMGKVQELREKCGFPFAISSAYRCSNHPTEARKSQPGTHAKGLAVDILVSGKQAHRVLKKAMAMGCFTGIGISQKGDHGRRFIHLDVSRAENRPWVWSY